VLNRRYVKALRTATLGILATAALIWGAVDIVGVSADALLKYVWLSIQGVVFVVIAAVPAALLLRMLRRRR
jgi:membrane protein implicated in regulation of membrane protease activity